mmetsp:Transcript_22750/g.49848  ORF Transcript_22750/g.49848 Transcript_22750/m.49848 type:complete len:257 (+) Transcript_22750:73-843(+)
MCWSAEVAAGFTLLELGLAIYLWRRNASPRDRYILPLALSVTTIEALEFLIWRSGPPSYLALADPEASCSPTNVGATVVAYFTLLSQPLMDGVFLFSTTRGGWLAGRLYRLSYWLIIGTMYLASIYKFTATHLDASVSALDVETIADPKSLYSNRTCTFVGPHGHLLWQFAMEDLTVPEVVEAAYFILGLSWFLYRPFAIGATFFVCFNALLIGNLVYFEGNKPESYSVWCWQGIFIYLFVLVEPWLFGKSHAKVQ